MRLSRAQTRLDGRSRAGNNPGSMVQIHIKAVTSLRAGGRFRRSISTMSGAVISTRGQETFTLRCLLRTWLHR